LDQLISDASLIFTEIEGCLMLSFDNIIMMVMVDVTSNEIEYIMSKPPHPRTNILH